MNMKPYQIYQNLAGPYSFKSIEQISYELVKGWYRLADQAHSKEDLTDHDKFALSYVAGAEIRTGYEPASISMTALWQTEPVGFVKENGVWTCYVNRDGKPVALTSRSCPSPSAQDEPSEETEEDCRKLAKLGLDGPDFYGDGL